MSEKQFWMDAADAVSYMIEQGEARSRALCAIGTPSAFRASVMVDKVTQQLRNDLIGIGFEVNRHANN